MTFEQALDAIQSAAQRASQSVSVALPRQARGDAEGAAEQLDAAENALRMALAGIIHAKALLAKSK